MAANLELFVMDTNNRGTGSSGDSQSGANGTIPWILRIGSACCFVGHGVFGVITKAAWVPYFAVAGVGEPMAWRLMPWVGWMDIAIGLLVLLWPCRALHVWGVVWCVWTALLRPLSGEPFWESLERAGNYGVPLAILAAVGLGGPAFGRLPWKWPELRLGTRRRLVRVLHAVTLTLLVGHAGLGLFSHKAGLAQHYAAVGFTSPGALVPLIGALEFMLAGVLFFSPRPGLLIFVCLWKVTSESLFLVSGAPIWELIERGGSYAAPLALAVLLAYERKSPASHPQPIETADRPRIGPAVTTA